MVNLKLFAEERSMDKKPIPRLLALLGILLLLTGCVALRSTAQILMLAGTEQNVPADPHTNGKQAGSNANAFSSAGVRSTVAAGSLLDLLRDIPDTPAHRQFLTFGDAAAWHEAWRVPRVDSFDAVRELPSLQRQQWLFGLSRQTLPPQVLGIQYLAVEEMDDSYGFSLFNAERYLESGQPPHNLTVVDTTAGKEHIVTTLTGAGYTCTPNNRQYLCSIREDNQVDLHSPSPIGRLGELNRIAVLDGRLLIGRATDPITEALATAAGDNRSLADDPFYQAAAIALIDPAITGNGALVGAILLGMPQFDDPLTMLDHENTAIQEQLARYAAEPLPPYALAAFATYRRAEATFLTVALVFPTGVDAQAAAATLAGRMQAYISAVTGRPLAEHWAFQQADAVEAAGLPVALVTMRVADPEEEAGGNWRIFNWADLVFRRDLHFLANGLPGVDRE